MVVNLPQELTVAVAVELRAQLLAALGGPPGALELDASAVADVDAAGLQVLCAARRTAEARGMSLTVKSGTCSPALARAVEVAGLAHAHGGWLAGEERRG